MITQREILTYDELCAREGARLQQGMHYRIGTGHSVLLMCCRKNAPYADSHLERGARLLYQGHDAPRGLNLRDPRRVDQPEFTASGRLTQNGAFAKAVELAEQGLLPPERVHVYQKLAPGIWSWNGVYVLREARREHDGQRLVFRFVLEPELPPRPLPRSEQPRGIPPRIRRAVWQRDQGRCVLCGATEDLHFDHIIPYSRGGSSLCAENVQLLCSRHNLRKSARI